MAGRDTPTVQLPTPLERLGADDVWLKREEVHELGSFKWRGALPALEELRAAGAGAVVTASTGNHGATVAWAARRLGLRAVVYVPHGSSRAKLALLEANGAELREHGGDLDEAKAEGVRAAAVLIVTGRNIDDELWARAVERPGSF